MKTGLYDVDSTIPNLALMKLAGYHKERGDSVDWWLANMTIGDGGFDKVYASTVFKDQPNDDLSDHSELRPEQMEIGGSGWGLENRLAPEVHRSVPDYTIYNYRHSIGFTARGCRFNCDFCTVPKKEGRPKHENTIEEIWTQRESNFVVLLDDDFFGGPQWSERVAELHKYDLKVCFSQGLNIRIITDEQCAALATLRFTNLHDTRSQVYFAWDRFKDERHIDAGIQRVIAAGIKPWQTAFFTLIGFDTTEEQDLYRVTKIRKLGCDAFAMPYKKKDPYQHAFARWVNGRLKNVEWKDYRGNLKKDAIAAETPFGHPNLPI